eukprot:5610360-Amphidinium_carterae.1
MAAHQLKWAGRYGPCSSTVRAKDGRGRCGHGSACEVGLHNLRDTHPLCLTSAPQPCCKPPGQATIFFGEVAVKLHPSSSRHNTEDSLNFKHT